MQKTEACKPEEVVKNEKRTSLKQILINNIKVLGVFCALSLAAMGIMVFGMFLVEYVFQPGKFETLQIIIVYGIMFFAPISNFLAHFFAGRRFLSSTKNPLLDSASYILIAVLAVIAAFTSWQFLFIMLYGPSLIISYLMEIYTGVAYEIPSLFFTVFLAILMQFLGMRKGVRRKSRG